MYYRLRHRYNYIYYTALGLLTLAVFIMQSVPIFPRVLYVLPLPLIPLTVCIAVFNSEVTGFAFGLAAGVLMDITSSAVDGYNAIIMTCIGLGIGLLTDLLFNDRFVTTALLSFFVTALYYIFYWLICILPIGADGAAGYLIRYSLPAAVYTWIFTLPFYYLIRRMFRASVSEPTGNGGLR